MFPYDCLWKGCDKIGWILPNLLKWYNFNIYFFLIIRTFQTHVKPQLQTWRKRLSSEVYYTIPAIARIALLADFSIQYTNDCDTISCTKSHPRLSNVFFQIGHCKYLGECYYDHCPSPQESNANDIQILKDTVQLVKPSMKAKEREIEKR